MDLSPAEALIGCVMVTLVLAAGLTSLSPKQDRRQLALGLAGSLTPLAEEYLKTGMGLGELRSRAGEWLQPYELELSVEAGAKLIYMLGDVRVELEAKPCQHVEASAMAPVQLSRGELRGLAIPYRDVFYTGCWLECYLAFLYESGEPAPPALKVEATLLDEEGNTVVVLGGVPVDPYATLYRVRWLIPMELSSGRYTLRAVYTGPGGLWAEASAQLQVTQVDEPPSLSELIPSSWCYRLGDLAELAVTKPGVEFSVEHWLKGLYLEGEASGGLVTFRFRSPVNLAPGVYVVEAAGCRAPVVLLPFPVYVWAGVGG
ncbi:MAG: hypothetical protein DRN96_08995 [Thermoproteota archaeon]|nr:MAG: hypothetical protein DRN96_08995 [Candidatus Korarchaeota archaeon]